MNDEIIRISDAFGNQHECKLLDSMYYNGEMYMLFEPLDPNIEMMYVFEVQQSGEDVQCIPVTDENQFLELLLAFKERMISHNTMCELDNKNIQQSFSKNSINLFDEPMRNKWVALILCFFLGCMGAHKFYEGKFGMGFVYLFTMGFFGIGVLIDLIILLFKPTHYIP